MSSIDLNTIAYDAPLSVPQPSWLWQQCQMVKGMKGTKAVLPAVELSGKCIIVTGGNSGIGREASIQFAAWGANIILACRDPPSHEPHPNKTAEDCLKAARGAGYEKNTIEWWEVDFAKLSSVEALAARWLDTGRPLDILCNNAGLGNNNTVSGKAYITSDGFELLHQVNYLAQVLLTLRLLPAIAKAAEPRIICTTSCAQFMGEFDLSKVNDTNIGSHVYSSNKIWFQTWLSELQRRMLQHDEYRHITVNGVHPGWVFSSIFQRFNPGDSWFDTLQNAFVKWLASTFFISEQQGSLCIVNAATSAEAGPNPNVQGVGAEGGNGGGRYYNRIWPADPTPYALDPDCRMRVWRKVNDELKLEEKGLLDVLGLKYSDGSRL